MLILFNYEVLMVIIINYEILQTSHGTSTRKQIHETPARRKYCHNSVSNPVLASHISYSVGHNHSTPHLTCSRTVLIICFISSGVYMSLYSAWYFTHRNSTASFSAF